MFFGPSIERPMHSWNKYYSVEQLNGLSCVKRRRHAERSGFGDGSRRPSSILVIGSTLSHAIGRRSGVCHGALGEYGQDGVGLLWGRRRSCGRTFCMGGGQWGVVASPLQAPLR